MRVKPLREDGISLPIMPLFRIAPIAFDSRDVDEKEGGIERMKRDTICNAITLTLVVTIANLNVLIPS